MKLSVIIPIYNEANTLRTLIERVQRVPLEKELILVDDGSTDGTRAILKELEHQENIRVVYHERNRGKGSAIRTGIQHVTGDMVLIQDADLEYDPRDYIRLIHPFTQDGAKVVYGSRRLNQNPSSYRRYLWGGILLTWIANLLYGTRITDEPTCYKVFDAAVLKGIDLKCTGFEFCPEVTAKVAKRGLRIHEVPISYHPRKIEEGKKIRWRHGVQAIWTLIKYRVVD